MKMDPGRSGRALAAAAAILAAGCASLPPLEGRTESSALQGTEATRLGAALAPVTGPHPGSTGIYPLPLPADAFAGRMLLAGVAERSLDAQYYIWHADQTGLLLLEALAHAAKRGVRVRLLIDDQNTRGMDELLAAMAARDNVEVRLYNPFAQRGARFLEYFGGFERLNRRMHNKVFIADNQVALVGGRNVGNEYFGAGTEIPFMDLDVVAVGAAVREASAEFDLYWASASAYPVARLLPKATPEADARLDARFAATRADPESLEYVERVRDTPLLKRLLEGRLPWEWARARLIHDSPEKTLDSAARHDVLLLSQLLSGGAQARASLDIISPYFVPAERGTAMLAELARKGVRVRVLTNSLGATDVALVHSGYAKRRCELARAGVRLYELKPRITATRTKEKNRGGSSGSSSARLHAKTFAADGERIFVGSFNFDPRSALLNTEMGLVIESRALAGQLSATFEHAIPENAYEVRARDGDGCIEWIERTAAGEVRHDSEPGAGWGRRAWLGFLTLLPIDWLL